MAWLASCVLYPVQASRKKHQDVLTAFPKVSLYKAGRVPFQGLHPGDALASSEPFPAWLDLSLYLWALKRDVSGCQQVDLLNVHMMHTFTQQQ